MNQNDLQLLRASFDQDTQQTIWEVSDHNGQGYQITSEGIVRFKAIRTEEIPSEIVGNPPDRIYVVCKDDILANTPVYRRVAVQAQVSA